MITRIYIDNYRCFTNFEVRPGRVNLLIGANGAGKSTLFEALANIVRLTVDGASVEDIFPGHTRTKWSSVTKQRFELEIEGEHGTYHYLLEIEHDVQLGRTTLLRESVKQADRTLFLYEKGKVELHENDGRPGMEFPFRGVRSFLPQLEERPENTLLTWFLSFLRGISLLKLDPTSIDAESRGESDSLHPDGANFSAWYRHLALERTEDLPHLFERLRDSVDGFQSMKTVGMGKGQKRELVTTFQGDSPGSKYEVGFDELSDGERAVVILYCLLIDVDGKAKTLLLDEPENFVGLKTVQPWLVEIADALRDEGQLFLVSHHPEVIDYLAADHSILLERHGGGHARVRLNPFDRDRGLKASELVARDLLHVD